MVPPIISINNSVRTRFAPSPTGYLHLGAARTALFSLAFARHFGGKFILRIEDTDCKRSTEQAVKAIINSMQWLGLDYDEGPFFQMKRIERYYQVLENMLQQGTAYYCYCSKIKINTIREQQRAAKKKPRYDGTCRPKLGKTLLPIQKDSKPVIRFRNPTEGSVIWNDVIKGIITVANSELDDLVIARSDGTPTYNFCVVVDDWDMKITHVIRGDDHINNTPRQINIFQALGGTIPQYGHLPMIVNTNGEKLSKRHGAVNILDYLAKGYLPEAMVNYLACLGWNHNNKEIFSINQFYNWFDLHHLSKSPAQFNLQKLIWFNNYYIKTANSTYLEKLIYPSMKKNGAKLVDGPALSLIITLLKERVKNLNELATAALMFYREPLPNTTLIKQYITDTVKLALQNFILRSKTVEWKKETLSLILTEILIQYKLKMSQLAMPLRLIVTGQLQTPPIQIILELLGRNVVLTRLKKYLN